MEWPVGEAQRSGVTLFAVVPPLALAATIRPELLVLGPALLVVHAWSRRGQVPTSTPAPDVPRWRVLAWGVLGYGLLLVPHLLHLQRVTAQQIDAGALPAISLSSLLQPIGVVIARNGLLDMWVFPTPWLLLALAWVRVPGVDRGTRRAAMALLALAFVSTGLVAIDLPDISIPRLHAAAAALAILALAPAAVVAWHRLQRLVPSLGRWSATALMAAMIAMAVAAAVPSAIARTARTNEDDEDAFIRDFIAALPIVNSDAAAATCVARLTYYDDRSTRVHLQQPDYLLLPPARQVRLLPLAALEQPSRLRGCREVDVLLGTRCWLRGADARERSGPIEACARAMRWAEAVGAEETLRRPVVNHRSDGFGWAPDDAELVLRSYRWRPPSR